MDDISRATRVTMVKKLLRGGEPCRKCAQAEEMLRRRDLWDLIDSVVLADESDDHSEGSVLAQKFGVKIAPFFLVERGGETVIYESAIKVAKEVLRPKKDDAERNSAFSEVSGSSTLTKQEVEELGVQLRGASAVEVVSAVLSRLGKGAAIAFSGAEDVALIDMAVKSGYDFSVFSLDTGRLHPQTYRFIDTVRQFYGIEMLIYAPDGREVEQLVRRKGLFSFYEDGHTECCALRKIAPLRRALGEFNGWLTGQRRDQSPTRTEVPEIAWDDSHKQEGMLKANPFAALTAEDVWKYIRESDVPYNELHDQGYASIGCEPCTRARRPGEHERAARWWWEDATKRECGLHVQGD
jgi:phosphoadenosine phosphosulfate reductase